MTVTAPYALAPVARAAGYSLDHCFTCASTNQRALQFDKAKAPDIGSAIWFTTDQQTDGRGRQGRIWQSGQGNLTASLLLALPKDTKDLHLLSFVAAIALHETLMEMLGSNGAELALKWPNDLLLKGAKLAGILLETQFLPDKSQTVVIGFGVNVNSAPKGMPYPVTAISKHCGPVSAQDVFLALSASWHNSFSLWDYGLGNAKVLSRWRKSAYAIGELVQVNHSGKDISGTFCDIDQQGRLIIETATGEKQTISAGGFQILPRLQGNI